VTVIEKVVLADLTLELVRLLPLLPRVRGMVQALQKVVPLVLLNNHKQRLTPSKDLSKAFPTIITRV
jgi:hypothetical protein